MSEYIKAFLLLQFILYIIFIIQNKKSLRGSIVTSILYASSNIIKNLSSYCNLKNFPVKKSINTGNATFVAP